MSTTRRKFLGKSILSTLSLTLGGFINSSCSNPAKESFTTNPSKKTQFPLVISTWSNLAANEAAMKVLSNGGSALDAVEQGVRIPEADPMDSSVGYGGLPDREGNVTLDACIMDAKGNCGAVCFLQHIKHPISVARKVMEDTPHVMLVRQGALDFALSKGFKKENLLTDESKEKWELWKKEALYKPIINVENHDTIGMLAIDAQGIISGACTTSGLAFKMAGRVGDSPIIGAGLYVDNAIGGAVATGMGEAVMRSVGSFLVVELMRQGRTPQEACKEAVMRIVEHQRYDHIQVGYIAVNKKGEYGSYCIQSGFTYTLLSKTEKKEYDSDFFMERKEEE